ncbi:hypothetical protein [Hyalangium sp.]|uniref:hypothetical protein n=1 Tax=Hyalangium sp. TaxID=2028555 RepID=UPI002D30C6CF|nr:hypothetical protein [Hyalangium sp.]HYH94540.1 hypothetical protein [Hyalangium sp.]
MAEDTNDAARQQVAAKVLETADQLARLLKGEKVPEADLTPTPDALLFIARDEQNRAEAAIFEELVDLVLPELKLMARPVRNMYATREGDPHGDMATILAFLGSQPVRHQQAEWLDVPGERLDGLGLHVGVPKDVKEGETGVLLDRDLWLLTDGRLVEVCCVGRWRIVSKRLHLQRSIITTRVIEGHEAVNVFPLDGVLINLRGYLHRDDALMRLEPGSNLAERRERFDALLTEYTRLMKTRTEGLRRAGDSPA